MGTKIKGIYKGFKTFSQIFAANRKEHEIEIGHPTDVKHVAHIGWDGPSGSAPAWMEEFKASSDYASTCNINETRASTWSSHDFESANRETTSDLFKEIPRSDLPKIPKKHRRSKKNKSTSSPKSSSSTRSSRATKSKSKLVEETARTTNIEVRSKHSS